MPELDSASEYIPAVRGSQLAIVDRPEHEVIIENADYETFGLLTVRGAGGFCDYRIRDDDRVYRRIKRALLDGYNVGVVLPSVISSRLQDTLRGGEVCTRRIFGRPTTPGTGFTAPRKRVRVV